MQPKGTAGQGENVDTMFIARQLKRDTWLAIVPLLIASGLAIWQKRAPFGSLELAFGKFAWLFWICLTVWLLDVVLAIRRRRWWLLLLTAPFVLYPVCMAFLLIGACLMGGECL